MVLTSSTLLAAHDASFDNMPKNKSLHGSFLMIFVKDILEDHTSQSSDCVVRTRCESTLSAGPLLRHGHFVLDADSHGRNV